MALDAIQIRFLRGLAHDLNPVVMIGQKGMSDGVRIELDDALTRHELVKIRVIAEDREERDEIIKSLARDTQSELIQKVGHTATFYRRAKKPKIAMPGDKPAKREDSLGERPSRDGQRPFRARRNEVGGGYGERPQRAHDPADTRPTRREDTRPPRREGGKYAKPPARSGAGASSKRPPRAQDIVGMAPRRERSFGGRADGPTHRPSRPARDFGDRPARPARDFGDRPARPARPAGNFADRPKRDFGDRPARPARPAGNFADRPKRDFGAKPAYKASGTRPTGKPAGNKPTGSPYKPLGAKRPKRETDED
ncbi:MAG TPA: ribosome assembly RNA-binding protein YhbY [Patescibacteria group bacterium]|nr:ribosome assembly RNA-binding protein YhbY [Patescibacteria group bacterium]